MLSEIGSWRMHENSGRFVGSRPRQEEADEPISLVADARKRYARQGGVMSRRSLPESLPVWARRIGESDRLASSMIS